MCFWFQQFLPPTLATFVLLIVGSRSIFSQPSDNTLLTTMYFGIHVRAKLEEPNIVQVKRLEGITLFSCIHQPAYWHIKGLSYSVLQKSPQKSFFSEDIKSICWRTIWYALTKYHHYYIGMEMGGKEHCCGGWRLKGLRKT